MSEAQNWILVACAIAGAVSLFYVAHFVEKLHRQSERTADVLRQIRDALNNQRDR